MGKAGTTPDAWDDDWEKQADAQVSDTPPPPAAKISKAERLAKHAESNKRLWDSADSADVFPYLAARDDVPLKTDFRPAVKVLTRRPVAAAASLSSAAAAAAGPHYDDDEDDEDGQGGAGKKALSPEELRLKAQRDREEKQRRYEEVRQRLFGSPSASATGAAAAAPSTAAAPPAVVAPAAATGSGMVASSNSTVGGVSLGDAVVTAAAAAAAAVPAPTPASAPAVNRPGSAQAGHALVEEQNSNSLRGRGGRGGRGGGAASGGANREQKPGELLLLRPAKGRAAEHGTRRQQEQQQQLYDPSYSRKPDSIYIQRRAAAGAEPLSTATAAATPDSLRLSELQINEIQPIRAPRGPPDSSGRGGFAARGRGGGMS